MKCWYLVYLLHVEVKFMRVLQLCFFSNQFPTKVNVVSIDIKNGTNIMDLNDDFGQDYDLILASPPCDQFTKANTLNWIEYPEYFILVAKKCLDICENSGKPFLYENPPGRIEKFIPALTKYRLMTWHGNVTNKEYVVYGNILLLKNYYPRYGKPGSINNYSKRKREIWQKDFYDFVIKSVL
jgi:site-specific DNA-cytosine methylase